MSIRSFILCSVSFVFLVSCDKDPEQTGCTDPIAMNYDPNALKEDGSCQYNAKEQIIWADGMVGGWNNDLVEGAYRMDVCDGETSTIQNQIDSATVEETLFLGTGGEFSHRSLFTLINERDARDFAEGSLRFEARLADNEGGSPPFINLFISGKLWQNNDCDPYRRSEFVQISTHSFNDSTFTSVNVTLREFEEIMMKHVNVVCGFEFEGDRSTGIEINNLRWVANDLD